LYSRFWDWAMNSEAEWIEHEKKRALRFAQEDAAKAN
jgi:hypothetical protein